MKCHLQCLILDNNKIGADFGEALKQLILNGSEMKKLSLVGNPLTDSAINGLMTALDREDPISNIESLIFSDCKLSSKGMQQVLDLIKVYTRVKVLILDNNCIDADNDNLHLEMGKQLNKNNYLQHLSLSGCAIDDKFVSNLCMCLFSN